MSTKDTISFLIRKKKEFKDAKYRKKFDSLYREIDLELMDTSITKQRLDAGDGINQIAIVSQRADGSTDWAVRPVVNRNLNDSVSRVPRAKEPIHFSKILVAASAVASRCPDGTAYSTNKIKARAWYELWKRSWTVPEMNGQNTLQTVAQNTFTYGWAAWRQYPKKIEVEKTINGKKIPKIIFDDIYREPLDPRRTWLGTTYKPYSNDNRPEVLYEYDITKEEYEKKKKRFGKRARKVESLKDNKNETAGLSREAHEEDPNKTKTHVTITVYENPADNRYIVASSDIVFYDGEMPNEDVYGSVVTTQCFSRDMNDPHGVGLFEFMRGNVALYNYINSLNAEQIEAEIFPLIFLSTPTPNGDLTYQRTPNKANVLPANSKLDIVRTTGNVTLGINYANAQKQNLEDNTGVNNIVSGNGTESTVAGTVILKEAALNRLVIPRNSIAQAIENDATIFFSWLEQDEAEEREYIFSTEEEVKEFVRINPAFHHVEVEGEEGEGEEEMPNGINKRKEGAGEVGEMDEDEEFYDENGMPVNVPKQKYTVLSSLRVPISFDYSSDMLKESDFKNQDIQELGNSSIMVSRSNVIKKIKELDQPEYMGYDRVTIKVDTNSMIIPSIEIAKQASLQLFPIVQSSIQLIFGLMQQDPEQAKVQLTALTKFIETQKADIFHYIPKEAYDKIMQSQPQMPEQNPLEALGLMGGLQGPGAQGQGMGMGMTNREGTPLQADNTPVTQPQSPQELSNTANNGSPMSSAYNASIGRGARGQIG